MNRDEKILEHVSKDRLRQNSSAPFKVATPVHNIITALSRSKARIALLDDLVRSGHVKSLNIKYRDFDALFEATCEIQDNFISIKGEGATFLMAMKNLGDRIREMNFEVLES